MKAKTRLTKIGNAVSTLLVILTVALAGYILYAKASAKPVFFGNYAYIYVKTESMEPAIPARSYIRVEKITAADVSTEDVIVFYSDDEAIYGQLNTHRVVGVAEDGSGFITKGDNNVLADKPIARNECVVARYVGPAPLLTALSSFFLTKAGLVVTLVAIFVLCLGMYLPDLIKNVKTSEAEASLSHDEWMKQKIAEEVEKLQRENAVFPKENEAPKPNDTTTSETEKSTCSKK